MVTEINKGSKSPAVVVWFKVYTGLMALLYFSCFIGGLGMFYFAGDPSGELRVELYIQGAILSVIGLPFAIACTLPFVLPRKPWVWVYDIVIIVIGMTSCCCIPACVPLLIFWLKPETKIWFGRNS